MLNRLVCWILPLICVASGLRARAEEPRGANLPLKRVVLFSSGVGFFEHSGKVQDNAKVEMKFKVGDINDLLKSMVVQDLDGGQVSTVTYGSKDPITKTLKSFAIDLTANPTLGPTAPAGPRRAGRARSAQRAERRHPRRGNPQEEARRPRNHRHRRAQPADRPGPAGRGARYGQPHQAGQRATRRRAAQGAGRAGLGPRRPTRNRSI